MMDVEVLMAASVLFCQMCAKMLLNLELQQNCFHPGFFGVGVGMLELCWHWLQQNCLHLCQSSNVRWVQFLG